MIIWVSSLQSCVKASLTCGQLKEVLPKCLSFLCQRLLIALRKRGCLRRVTWDGRFTTKRQVYISWGFLRAVISWWEKSLWCSWWRLVVWRARLGKSLMLKRNKPIVLCRVDMRCVLSSNCRRILWMIRPRKSLLLANLMWRLEIPLNSRSRISRIILINLGA